MSARTTFLAAALVTIVALVLCAAVLAGRGQAERDAAPAASPAPDAPRVAEPRSRFYASWKERPRSVEELTARATAIVRAEVVEVDAGPGLAVAEHEAIPTQRVTMRVTESIAGPRLATFTLFKTGSSEVHVDGDPFYTVGEEYLLYLEPRVDGQGRSEDSWLPVAPDGRLFVRRDETLLPLIEGEVASRLHGRAVADAHRVSIGGRSNA